MKPTSALLEHLCHDHRTQQIAEMLANANTDEIGNHEFWVGINSALKQSVQCTSFGQYLMVANCHVMCVATFPHCARRWLQPVLEELSHARESWIHDATFGLSMDAYEMGSLLGVFKAGNWLQANSQELLDPAFLSEMSNYCYASIGHRRSLVNSDFGSREEDRAQQELGHAIKDYLRPQNATLAKQVRLQMRPILEDLRNRLAESPLRYGPDCLTGAGRWILEGFVHGVLDIPHRKTQDLIPAALALLS